MVREWLHVDTLAFCSTKGLPPTFLLPLWCSTLFHSRCHGSVVPETLWQHFSFVVLLSLSSCHYSQNICCQHEHYLFFISFSTFFFVALTVMWQQPVWQGWANPDENYIVCVGKTLWGRGHPVQLIWDPHSFSSPFSFFLSFLIFSALELLCDISCGPNNKSSSMWTCLKLVCTKETL